MRIVVVNNFFPPRTGGSSHLADSLARGYARAGHEVLVVTAAYQDAPAEERLPEGVRVVRLPAFMIPESKLAVSFDISFASRPSLRKRLAKLLDDFRPDVIHQHGQFFDLTWASGRYARRRQVPTLLSVHTRLENPSAKYRHVFGALDRFVVLPRLRAFRPRIVVMDAHMHDYITARYAGAFRDLVDIPVGVDPEWIKGGDREQGRDLLKLGDEPVIMSIGHVIPQRHRLGVVEAMPGVLAKHPRAKLVVVGRVYYDLFLQRAQELGIQDSVVTLGAVPKAQIPDLIAAADVECHEQGDGLGTATLEAMAAGTPVVGWGRLDNFPGIPLYDGKDIYLAPPGDVTGLANRINAVLDDPGAGAEVGQRGQQIITEHFGLQQVTDQYL
ncbi:MAG TPA: glycosyltransferase family 4 protein, partial [Marmoricola sp.]|nr:glycosyltransferase family 4 protein [Marmoricola sp.]